MQGMQMTSLEAQRSKSMSPRTVKYIPVEVEADVDDEESPPLNLHPSQEHAKTLQHSINPSAGETICTSTAKDDTAGSTPEVDLLTNVHSNRKHLFFNGHNVLRITMLFATLLFICLCILYGFGQILSLQLESYFCEPKTLEEIRQHSLESGLNHGTSEGCWTTSSNKVDENKLFYAGSYAAYESTWDLSPANLVKFALFMLIAFFLVLVFIWFLVGLLRDCNRLCCNRGYEPAVTTNKDHGQGGRSRKWRLVQTVQGWKQRYYDGRFDTHSTYWVLKLLAVETVEIIIQISVFLQYGGAQNGVLYVFYSADQMIPAESKPYVLLFAVVLCANCIVTGLLWMLYLCKRHITEHFNQGMLFADLSFLVNAVFDTFYSVFPLLLLGDNLTVGTGAAALSSSSFITFLSVYYPLLFLSLKLCIILNHCSAQSREQWNVQLVVASLSVFPRPQSNLEDYHAGGDDVDAGDADDADADDEKDASDDESRCCLCCRMFCDGAFLDYDVPTTYGDHEQLGFIIECAKRVLLALWSLSLITIGIVIVCLCIQHFARYEYVCQNPTTSQLEAHPELSLWPHCNYKVYPFFSDDGVSCNCRGAIIDDQNQNLNTSSNITIDAPMIASLLQHWDMLEVFKLQVPHSVIAVNLTENMLQSKNMRVLQMDNVAIHHIDDAFGENWVNLEFLRLQASFSSPSHNILPNSTLQLRKLRYIDLSYNLFLPHNFVDVICSFTHLRVLILTFSSIPVIPRCLLEFTELIYLDITGATGEVVDIQLLNLQNLKDLVWVQPGELTESSFIGYADNETQTFDYNQNTRFSFQGSQLCWNYFGTSEIEVNGTVTLWPLVSDTYYPYLYEFLNTTASCEYYCDYYTVFDFAEGICFPAQWNNGICDTECDTGRCALDGGDCHQLCACNTTLLLNDECDLQCNTTECNYDEQRCIDSGAPGESYLEFDNYTQCLTHTMCSRQWIGDGVCDESCKADICDYDQTDCDGCFGICNLLWNEYFPIFGNGITVDYQLDEQESCLLLWPFVYTINNGDHFLLSDYNCSTVITEFDYDGNGKLSGYEIMDPILLLAYQFDKVGQVNCSQCAESTFQYMHGDGS